MQISLEDAAQAFAALGSEQRLKRAANIGTCWHGRVVDGGVGQAHGYARFNAEPSFAISGSRGFGDTEKGGSEHYLFWCCL